MKFIESNMHHKTSPYVSNRFRVDLGVRRMCFKHYFDIFRGEVEIDHFGCGASKGKITKNCWFLWFFRFRSNHHIMTSIVFGNGLGTQRRFWKHQIVFSSTLWRKIEIWPTNQNFKNFPKIAFGAKIEFLQNVAWCPNMMIYGTRWVPLMS